MDCRSTLLPADGDVCVYAGRVVLLHPGSSVEDAREQEVDERHYDWQGQQTGFLQERVLSGNTRSVLEVLQRERGRKRERGTEGEKV